MIFDNKQKEYLQHLIALNNKLDFRPLYGPNYPYEINDIYVPLKFQLLKSKQNIDINLFELMTKFNKKVNEVFRYVIIGKPGSGKSTFLKYLTVQIAQNRLNLKKTRKLPNKLPILIDFSQQNPPTIPDQSLSNYIIENGKSISITEKWLDRKLKNGDCIIFLDSYDVVTETEVQKNISTWVQKQMDDYFKCPFIICSRPFGYFSNQLNNVNELTINDFDTGQIHDFIHKIYLADEIIGSMLSGALSNPNISSNVVKREAKIRADDLGDQLEERLTEHPALLNLALNPLLLTMITVVYAARRNLPGRRAALYREMLEVNLDERYRKTSKTHDPLSPDLKAIILSFVAYYMMSRKVTSIKKYEILQVISEHLKATPFEKSISSEEFLDLMTKYYGLLIEKEVGEFGFAHHTFQEFLTSYYYLSSETLTSEFAEFIGDGWWEEVIRLYSAQTANATAVLKLCLKQLENDPIPIEVLILTRNILAEALLIDSIVREDIQKVLNSLANDPDPSKWKQSAIATIMARLRFMTHISGNIYIDTSLITNAEYQLFVDAMIIEKNKYYFPDHWIKDKYLEGQALLPVVGVRPSDLDQFVKWIPRFEVSPTIFRIPTDQEADQVNINSGENTYKYFVKKSGADITLNNSSGQYLLLGEDVINLIERDLKVVKRLKSAIEHSHKTPPTAEELLSRVVPFFDGGGSGSMSRKRSDTSKTYLPADEEDVLTGRFLLNEYILIAAAFDLNIKNYAVDIYNRFYFRDAHKELKYDWATNTNYIAFDIGASISRYLYCRDSKQWGEASEFAVAENSADVRRAMELIMNREWHAIYRTPENTFAKVAPDRMYNFLRWYCRIGLIDMLFGYIQGQQFGKAPNYSYKFSETEKLFYQFVILENRIKGQMPISEGIRIVKIGWAGSP